MLMQIKQQNIAEGYFFILPLFYPLLLFQSEFLDNRIITVLVVRLKIAQMRAAISDHLQKSAAGVDILWIFLEMLGKLVNLLREEHDLHVRGAGICVVAGDILDNRHLFLRGKHAQLSYHGL